MRKDVLGMNRQLKNILCGTGFGVVLFVFLINYGKVLGSIGGVISMLQPILIGGVLAFVLNVPMKKIETVLEKRTGKKKKIASYRGISLFLTILAIIAIIAILCVVIIPQIIASATTIVEQIQVLYPQWIVELEKHGFDTEWLESLYTTLMDEKILSEATGHIGSILTTLTGTISTVAGAVVNVVLAIVFMVYFLLDKDRLSRQCKKMVLAYLPERISKRLIDTGKLMTEMYASFLGRQCVEAVILGLLMWISYMIFQLPYSGLVAILTGFLSFIPYVGGFLACGVGVFVIYMVDPWKALLSIVVFLVTQFIENQFIYPRVVGGAVGLPPLWTLVAVFLGGELMGIIGMIFFIPLVATVYILIRDDAEKRLAKKGIVREEESPEQEVEGE